MGTVKVGEIEIGKEFVIIAGPCVIEGRDSAFFHADFLKRISLKLGVPIIFKSSYDKANRTSLHSFRGPGLKKGLEILFEVKSKFGLNVISDVHRFEEIDEAKEVLDIIQVPAFLCRQADFVIEIARTKKPINIKKGQFLSPYEMRYVIEKAESTGNRSIMVTERGTTFGYNNLVVDMRSLIIMKDFGYPVIFDATHSVQLPGGAGVCSSGEARFAPYLAKAACAVGVDGIFMEVHRNPKEALCDGPNSLHLSDLYHLIEKLKSIREVVKGE